MFLRLTISLVGCSLIEFLASFVLDLVVCSAWLEEIAVAAGVVTLFDGFVDGESALVVLAVCCEAISTPKCQNKHIKATKY